MLTTAIPANGLSLYHSTIGYHSNSWASCGDFGIIPSATVRRYFSLAITSHCVHTKTGKARL